MHVYRLRKPYLVVNSLSFQFKIPMMPGAG